MRPAGIEPATPAFGGPESQSTHIHRSLTINFKSLNFRQINPLMSKLIQPRISV